LFLSCLRWKKALATEKYSDASIGQFFEHAAVDEERQIREFNKRRKYELNF
jgi:hypothetical protein